MGFNSGFKRLTSLLMKLLGRYARVVDCLAANNVAQGAPLGGGSTLHPSFLDIKGSKLAGD